MNLALSVAENVMGGSPSLRSLILGVLLPQLASCHVIPPISLLRRMSVKPPEEEKGIFKRKKTTEPVMVFSFAADEVAGVENLHTAWKWI